MAVRNRAPDKNHSLWGQFNRRLGTLPIKKPQCIKLGLPFDISAASGRKLGMLFSKYTKLHAFYNTQIARAVINYESRKTDYYYLRSKWLLKATGRTIAERKAFMRTRKEVRRGGQNMLEARAFYELLKSYVRTCEGYINCVSREITRRGAEQRVSSGD